MTEIEVRKYTPKTRRWYRTGLNLFLRFCQENLAIDNVEEITIVVVKKFAQCMNQFGKKVTYINGLLKIAGSFLRYCYGEGYGGFNIRHRHFRRCPPDTAKLQRFLLYLNAGQSNFDYGYLKLVSAHGRQLTNSTVEQIIIKRRGTEEGIRVSPHICRHFYAQQQMKMGTDLYTIPRLLGHRNIQITQMYLNSLRDEEVIKITKQKNGIEQRTHSTGYIVLCFFNTSKIS